MRVLNYIEIIAALEGLGLSILLCAFPRFGPSSRMVVLILVPALLASAIQGISPTLLWAPDTTAFLSFACLILCAAAGGVTSYLFERASLKVRLRKHPWFFSIVLAAAPILIGGLYLLKTPSPVVTPDGVALGPAGFGGAAYLLLISVIILANLEQTLRNAEEHIRWEIKFLLLG